MMVGESMRCRVTEETDGGKCGIDDNVANGTRRNKEDNDCDQGKKSGVIVEEMPPLYVNSKKMEGNVWNKSLTAAVTKNITEYDRNLEYIPTELDENGECEGDMGSRILWTIIIGAFSMKFHHEEGFNRVVNIGPWMVRNKPFVVQKWNVNMNLDKTEPYNIPLWVKLCNVPLEAWAVKGISALEITLGKPLVMDSMIAKMCKQGNRKVEYARVLIKNKPDCLDRNKEKNDGFVKVKSKKNGGMEDRVKRQNSRKISREGKSNNSKKQWSMHKDILEAMKRSSNKFSVLEMYDVNEQIELNDLRNMEIVDEFLNKKKTVYEEEDVFEEENGIAHNMNENVVKGMDKGVLEGLKKDQEKDKIGSKRDKNGNRGEAGKNQKGVTVDRARKNEENKKRMNENAYTVGKLFKFKETRKDKGLICNLTKVQSEGLFLSSS
nr:ATPase, F1/V1/A1 complex, alpha/beta subunit, zinc knuckle CX2CX4HX4C [Tanacetum cinerariifolium]